MDETSQAATPTPRDEHSPATGDCDRGASLVEYALLLALIAVVCIIAIQFFGGETSQSFSESSSSLFVT